MRVGEKDEGRVRLGGPSLSDDSGEPDLDGSGLMVVLSLPTVLALTRRSLWDGGLVLTTIGSKGVSSSNRALHISADGSAG